MNLEQRLKKLKEDITRESSFNMTVTKKSRAIIDEVIKVLKERFNRLTNVLPEVKRQLGTGVSASGRKEKILAEIDSIKNEILLSRFIDNKTTEWAFKKLNQIKGLK